MLLQQITKELFREKTRIMLTILAIAQTVANTGHNLLTLRGGRVSKDYNSVHAGVKINLTKNDYNAIAGLPNIAAITPQHTLSAKLSYL